jgi:hypothetical protein
MILRFAGVLSVTLCVLASAGPARAQSLTLDSVAGIEPP